MLFVNELEVVDVEVESESRFKAGDKSSVLRAVFVVLAYPNAYHLPNVTESPRRYISEEVSSMSHLCPRGHGQTDQGREVLLASQKEHIGGWFSSREEPAISL